MKVGTNADRSHTAPRLVHHLPEGAELVLSERDTTVVVLSGACAVRSRSGQLERVEAGSVLLRRAKPAARVDSRVARALALLHAKPAKRWTVESLARAVGLSRSALARRFVATMGRAPLHHLSELRLALAAARLECSDESLAEVASHVGYGSEFAFSRAFKRQFGVAPGLFRRLCLDANRRPTALRLAA